MKKIVINTCYGGFSLSKKAFIRLKTLGNEVALSAYENDAPDDYESFCRGMERDDPDLIKVIEELGEEADGEWASLKIIEVPNSIEWWIEEHGGMERLIEKSRTWC